FAPRVQPCGKSRLLIPPRDVAGKTRKKKRVRFEGKYPLRPGGKSNCCHVTNVCANVKDCIVMVYEAKDGLDDRELKNPVVRDDAADGLGRIDLNLHFPGQLDDCFASAIGRFADDAPDQPAGLIDIFGSNKPLNCCRNHQGGFLLRTASFPGSTAVLHFPNLAIPPLIICRARR
ncbi:MAG: hypothetical protein WBP85_07460, partial [Terracidiphilus sp.]